MFASAEIGEYSAVWDSFTIEVSANNLKPVLPYPMPKMTSPTKRLGRPNISKNFFIALFLLFLVARMEGGLGDSSVSQIALWSLPHLWIYRFLTSASPEPNHR